MHRILLIIGATLGLFSPDACHAATHRILLGWGAMRDSRQIEEVRRPLETLRTELSHFLPATFVIEEPGPMTGASITRALREGNVAGVVFIGHAFKSDLKLTGGLYGADGYPLPLELLSAASSATRFVALLGCEGNAVRRFYAPEETLVPVPGEHELFIQTRKLLVTQTKGFKAWVLRLIFPDLRKVLRNLAVALKRFDWNAVPFDSEEPGIPLEIDLRDIFPQIEPRFVLVNGKTVGVFGDRADEKGALSIRLRVPEWAIDRKAPCQRIQFKSSELTTGASAVDDYVVDRVVLGGGRDERVPWHIGDDFGPPEENATPDSADPLGQLRLELKKAEWIEPMLEIWKTKPKRIYSQCVRL